MIILALNLYNHFTSTDYLRTEKDISNYPKNRRSAWVATEGKKNLRGFFPANNLVAKWKIHFKWFSVLCEF